MQKTQGGQAVIILWGFEPWDLPLQTASVQTVHTARLLTPLQPQHQAGQQRLQQLRSEELVQTKPHTHGLTPTRWFHLTLLFNFVTWSVKAPLFWQNYIVKSRKVSYLRLRDFTRLHDVILTATRQYQSSVPFLARRTTAITPLLLFNGVFLYWGRDDEISHNQNGAAPK